MKEKPIARTQEPKKRPPLSIHLLGFYNYTIVATLVGLTISLLGVWLAVQGLPLAAVYCLLIAGGFHLFDGKIARTKALGAEESAFGKTIDLLADLTAFALLPVTIGYAAGMDSGWFLPFSLIYVLAATLRQIYLHVTDEERKQSSTEHRQIYLGLPIASIGLILPLFYLLYGRVGNAFPWLLGVLMLLLAAAFLIRVRLPRVGMKFSLVYLLLGVAELVLLAFFGH